MTIRERVCRDCRVELVRLAGEYSECESSTGSREVGVAQQPILPAICSARWRVDVHVGYIQ